MGEKKVETSIINTSYAILILITMIVLDYFLGNMLMGFANSQENVLGLIIMIMITFVLFFGTFIIPLLIIQGRPVIPTNMILGIGSLMLGVPAIIIIYQTLGTITDTLLTGELSIIANLFMLVSTIAVGVIIPIFSMTKEEPILEGMLSGGE